MALNMTFVQLLKNCDSHGGLTASRLGQSSNCGGRGGSTTNPIPAIPPVDGATLPERSTTAWVRLSGVRLRGSKQSRK